MLIFEVTPDAHVVEVMTGELPGRRVVLEAADAGSVRAVAAALADYWSGPCDRPRGDDRTVYPVRWRVPTPAKPHTPTVHLVR